MESESLFVKCSWAFDKPTHWDSMTADERRALSQSLLLQAMMEATTIEGVENFIDAGFDSVIVKKNP